METRFDWLAELTKQMGAWKVADVGSVVAMATGTMAAKTYLMEAGRQGELGCRTLDLLELKQGGDVQIIKLLVLGVGTLTLQTQVCCCTVAKVFSVDRN